MGLSCFIFDFGGLTVDVAVMRCLRGSLLTALQKHSWSGRMDRCCIKLGIVRAGIKILKTTDVSIALRLLSLRLHMMWMNQNHTGPVAIDFLRQGYDKWFGKQCLLSKNIF